MVASVKYGVAPHSSHHFDDFLGLNTSIWTAIEADDTSAVAHDADGVGGLVSVLAGGTDNHEAYLHTPELFKFAADKPCVADVRLSFAEANTDDANILVGFMDGVAANALVDNGAGPKASFDGAVFYKVDGGTRWQVRSSNAASNVSHDTEYVAGKSGFQTLRIEFQPISSDEGLITFWIDPEGGQNFVQCKEYGSTPRQQLIQHTIQLTGLEEMALVIGVKAGGANAETVLVDYSQWAACR